MILTPNVEAIIKAKSRRISQKRNLKLEYEDLVQDGYRFALSLYSRYPDKPEEWMCIALQNMYKKLSKTAYARSKVIVSFGEIYDVAGEDPEEEMIERLEETR
jgi:DNA-directed RNA polymerase specialized sigma24 family protein